MRFRSNVNSSRILAVVSLILLLVNIGIGQHQGHQMPKPDGQSNTCCYTKSSSVAVRNTNSSTHAGNADARSFSFARLEDEYADARC